jgi:hypothetical protein
VSFRFRNQAPSSVIQCFGFEGWSSRRPRRPEAWATKLPDFAFRPASDDEVERQVQVPVSET